MLQKKIPLNAAPREWLHRWRDAMVAERNRRGWSQKRLAQAVGLTQSQIARLEADPFQMRAHVLFHVLHGLGIEPPAPPRTTPSERQ